MPSHFRTAVVGVLSMASIAGGQGIELRPPASVPVELATALMMSAGMPGGDAQILVGEFPSWIASTLKLPKGAEILGSAFTGTIMVGIVTYPSSADTVVRLFEKELLTSGWKLAPPPPSYGGGFRSANMAPSARTPATLCGDKAILYVVQVRQRAGVSTMMLRYSSTAGAGNVCNPLPQQPGYQRSPFPTLYNPQASDGPAMQACYENSSMGSSSTQTRLRTPMPPDAVIEHYGRQLQDSGWTSQLAMPVATAARTWTRRDTSGAITSLTLTVAASARDTLCRNVTLDVLRPTTRP